MKVGFIGLGKLGLPVALTFESKGHEVAGYDINPAVQDYVNDRKIPYQEAGLQPLLDKTELQVLKSVKKVVEWADMVFCPVQTPHDARFEGTTRLPADRADFDYSYLISAVKSVSEAAEKLQKRVTLVVISTCLPGTFTRDILPVLSDKVDYVYNPMFIAMGTVRYDVEQPEFTLIGCQNRYSHAVIQLQAFYKTIHSAPHLITDITTAEGIKVSYNTWITAKTVIANLWGELAHKTGMDFNDLYKAWTLSTERLISPKYMKAGMGDGGGCHPRDNIALSHIAREVGLSHNIFEDLMRAREATEEWHARLALVTCNRLGLPLVILGRSFKPETNIETGSPALLMASILDEMGQPYRHVEDMTPEAPAVYFIATQHARYSRYKFPKGSAVIDPFRYIPSQFGVEIIRLGAKI